MYLFIDTLSDPCYISLFDTERRIKSARTWPGKQHEFDTLAEEIDTLLQENNLPYGWLRGIVILVWPGGFTGTRVAALVVNAISYGYGTPLFPLTAGELFMLQDAELPWIMPVTKKEVLLWREKKSDGYSLALISELPEGSYTSLCPVDFHGHNHTMRMARDYPKAIAGLSLSDPHARVTPLYAKEPNITLKKISYAK